MALVALLLVYLLAWYVQTMWVFYLWWALAFVLAIGKYAASYSEKKK